VRYTGIVENKANRESEVQLTFVRFVDLASVEARADDVQLCLSERALHAEPKAVVELEDRNSRPRCAW
jgi:hypothetical protein